MIFTDLIFVFAFLPVYFIAVFCLSENWSKNTASLIGSLLFLIWGRSIYYALIVLPIFAVYLCGRLIPKFKYFEQLGSLIAVISAAVMTALLPNDGALVSSLISVGFILFALRALRYLSEVSGGLSPETNWLKLAVYLISFEGMLSAPVLSYAQSRKYLDTRRASLKKAADGLPIFIFGFARASLFGLVFERVRLSATEYEAFPWANAVWLIVITAAEAYVLISGLTEMSRGIALINGLPEERKISAFVPRTGLCAHVGELLPGLDRTVYETVCRMSASGFYISLFVMAALSAGLYSLERPAAACFIIILIGMAISGRYDGKIPAADGVFTAVVVAFSAVLLAGGGPDGLMKLFGSERYEYDITYILYYELTHRAFWLIAGLIFTSPLTRLISRCFERLAEKGGKRYAVARLCETAVCMLLLILSAAAAAQ